MNVPHAYTPALRSEDLAPIDTRPHNSKRKILQALVLLHGHGYTAIQHAGRGHELAFIETGSVSRWIFKRGGATADLFADLIRAADSKGRRWRIVHVISGEIRAEG